eukprot:scpid44388/ scgid20677/ 
MAVDGTVRESEKQSGEGAHPNSSSAHHMQLRRSIPSDTSTSEDGNATCASSTSTRTSTVDTQFLHPSRKESETSTHTTASSSTQSSRTVSAASLASISSLDTDSGLGSSARFDPLNEQDEAELFPEQVSLGQPDNNDDNTREEEETVHCGLRRGSKPSDIIAASGQHAKRPSLTRSETIDMGELPRRKASLSASAQGDSDKEDDAGDGGIGNGDGPRVLTAEQVRKKRMIKRRTMHIPELLLPGTVQIRKKGLAMPKPVHLPLAMAASSPEQQANGFLSPPGPASPLTMSTSADSLLRRFQPSGALSAPSSPILHRRSHTGVSNLARCSTNDSDSDSTDGGGSEDPYMVRGSYRRGNSFKFPLRVSLPSEAVGADALGFPPLARAGSMEVFSSGKVSSPTTPRTPSSKAATPVQISANRSRSLNKGSRRSSSRNESPLPMGDLPQTPQDSPRQSPSRRVLSKIFQRSKTHE